MPRRRTEDEYREFYEWWSATVFTFCRWYVGDEEVAGQITGQAFLEYLKRGLALDMDHLPVALLRYVLEAAQDCSSVVVEEESADFELMVLMLPAEERAVFLLHGLLGLQLPWVSTVMSLPFESVGQLWVQSLARLRSELPTLPNAHLSAIAPAYKNSLAAGEGAR